MDKASVTQAKSTPESTTLHCIQGSHPFQPETNFQGFSRIHINFSRTLKFTYPFTPKISMFEILDNVSHTFHILLL